MRHKFTVVDKALTLDMEWKDDGLHVRHIHLSRKLLMRLKWAECKPGLEVHCVGAELERRYAKQRDFRAWVDLAWSIEGKPQPD